MRLERCAVSGQGLGGLAQVLFASGLIRYGQCMPDATLVFMPVSDGQKAMHEDATCAQAGGLVIGNPNCGPGLVINGLR